MTDTDHDPQPPDYYRLWQEQTRRVGELERERDILRAELDCVLQRFDVLISLVEQVQSHALRAQSYCAPAIKLNARSRRLYTATESIGDQTTSQ